MCTEIHAHERPPGSSGWIGYFRSRWGIGTIVLLAIGAYLLATEHQAHLFGALPWLLLLACPLMHLFMHHGHDHGASPERDAGAKPPSNLGN